MIFTAVLIGIGVWFYLYSKKKNKQSTEQKQQKFKEEEEWIWNRPKKENGQPESYSGQKSSPEDDVKSTDNNSEDSNDDHNEDEHIISNQISIESDSFQGQSSNLVHPLSQIIKNSKDQVSFPESYNPDAKYYLTSLSFQPQYENEVEYKAGKKGHYIRNTLLFGIVGTILTHNKDGEVISKKIEVPSTGYLNLVSEDFKNSYTVAFTAFKSKADEIKANYVIDNDEFNYLKEQYNK